MHFFNAQLVIPDAQNALIAELARGVSLDELLDQLYKVDRVRLPLTSLLIIRPPVALPLDPRVVDAVLDGSRKSLSPELQFLDFSSAPAGNPFYRFPDRPVHLLFSHEHRYFLSKNINNSAVVDPLSDNSDAVKGIIDIVRTAELDYLLHSSRARFPPMTGVSYRTPAGELVPTFLRVGNIQRSRAALDALFFGSCLTLLTVTASLLISGPLDQSL